MLLFLYIILIQYSWNNNRQNIITISFHDYNALYISLHINNSHWLWININHRKTWKLLRHVYVEFSHSIHCKYRVQLQWKERVLKVARARGMKRKTQPIAINTSRLHTRVVNLCKLCDIFMLYLMCTWLIYCSTLHFITRWFWLMMYSHDNHATSLQRSLKIL